MKRLAAAGQAAVRVARWLTAGRSQGHARLPAQRRVDKPGPRQVVAALQIRAAFAGVVTAAAHGEST